MEFDLMDMFFLGGNEANTMEISLDVDDIPFIEGRMICASFPWDDAPHTDGMHPSAIAVTVAS
jgi:hypothetical protein